MASTRSHSRHMRRGRFDRVRHRRDLLAFLTAQGTRLASSATGHTIAAKIGVATLTGDGSAMTAADTVTVGSKTYTIKTALTFAAAVSTFTNDGSQPADTSTVVIDGRTYTFQSSLTNVDGHVKIGASNTATMTNLFHAINASGGTVGTDYATLTTAHPTVTATNPSGTTVVITAITKGAAGNALATTVGGTIHGSWTSTVMAGGADDVANEVLRASASATLTNLFHAINATGGTAGTDYSLATAANTPVVATNPSGTTVLITAVVPGAVIATTASSSHASWDVAVLTGGDANKVTATSHGQTNYEGAYTLTTSGSLPGGLALATPYFVNVVDANTLRFAKSVEALRLGDYITLTSAGSGTHTLKRAVSNEGIYDLLRTNTSNAVRVVADVDSLR